MTLRALIFDVDGTLADTEEAHRTAWNLAFERWRLGWTWSPDMYRELLKTTGGKERVRRYIDTLALTAAEHARLVALIPSLHAEQSRFYGAFVADGTVPLREGVERLLNEARDAGCRLAVASATARINFDALMTAALGPRGPDWFSVVACGDVVPSKKPAPDIFLLALRELQVAADDAIAFEDSAMGLRSSVAAGLRTVVTPTHWTADGDFSAATLLLPNLQTLRFDDLKRMTPVETP